MKLQQYYEQYDAGGDNVQLAAEMRLLEASFARAGQHKAKLGETYPQLEAIYTDIQAIYSMEDEPVQARRRVLYAAYDAYFALLKVLPYSLRYHLRADRDMGAMRRLLKKGPPDAVSQQFWRRFAITCLPPMAVFVWGEIQLIDALYEGAPPWQTLLYLLCFVGGMGVYIYFGYNLEGLRHHGELHKWLRFKAAPHERDRPADILQYIKMLLPLAVALGSAMIKLYFQN